MAQPLNKDMASVQWLQTFFQQSPIHSTLIVVIDGGGTAIGTGVKGDHTIHFPCRIVAWRLLADQSGSIVIDIWKDTYANFPPTIADTICAASLPTLSSTDHNEDTALTGWTKEVASGDTLRFNVNSASTVTRVTLALSLHKPAKT